MANITDKLWRLLIDRQMTLERVKSSEVRRVIRAVEQLEADLISAAVQADPAGVTSLAAQQARTFKLLTRARQIIAEYHREGSRGLTKSLFEVAKAETKHVLAVTNKAIGVNLMNNTLSRESLRAIASDTVIEGAPSKEWWRRQGENLRQRFSDTIRQAMLRGEPTPDLVKRISGTRAAGFADGVMLGTQRQATALVRTSIQHVANTARIETYEANQDVVDGLQWVSTLDERTTDICMSLSGLEWTLPNYEPINHGQEWPGPTAHYQCRSTQVAVLKSWEELGKDPKSVTTEAGGRSNPQAIFEKNLRAMGASQARIDRSIFNARASMDGQVSSRITFNDWLKGRSVAAQDRMLGKGRAQLWREGKITLRDLTDQKNRPLPLSAL